MSIKREEMVLLCPTLVKTTPRTFSSVLKKSYFEKVIDKLDTFRREKSGEYKISLKFISQHCSLWSPDPNIIRNGVWVSQPTLSTTGRFQVSGLRA